MIHRESKIKAIVQSVSLIPGAEPLLDEPLFESGVLDSFGLLDLVKALEEEFSVQIPDSALTPTSFSTIRAIDAHLEKVLVAH